MPRWTYGWTVLLLVLPSVALAATYSITLNAAQEAIIQEELDFRQSTATIQQSVQRLVNREVADLGREQDARTVQEFNNMVRITTPAAQDQAEAALASGISPPVIADVPNQTHNVNQAVTVPLQISNPYPQEMAITVRLSGQPPGITLGSNDQGSYQLVGTLTTAGTFNVTITAYNVSAVQATETLVWTVNP